MFERYRKFQDQRATGAENGDQADEEGFTLIELLIVVVVLGILAAVTVLGLSSISGTSYASSCNADARSVEVATEAFRARNGAWPTQAELLDATAGNAYLHTWPGQPTHYTIGLDSSNGVVSVTTPAGTNPYDPPTVGGNNGCFGVK